MMNNKLKIDVFFDFICPWCLIGKRHLQNALDKFKQTHPHIEPVINWRGVQLIPDVPIGGVPFNAFYLRRLGSQTAIRIRQAQVRGAANAVKLDINFESIMRMPNTAKAHNMYLNVSRISPSKFSERFLEGIFSAYFHHGEDIGETEVLKKIASYCGIQESVIEAVSNETFYPFISADTGGKGVPYFVFNGRLALAGAQHAEVLYSAMIESLEAQANYV